MESSFHLDGQDLYTHPFANASYGFGRVLLFCCFTVLIRSHACVWWVSDMDLWSCFGTEMSLFARVAQLGVVVSVL